VLKILQATVLGCFGELLLEFRIPSGERVHRAIALAQKNVPKPMLGRDSFIFVAHGPGFWHILLRQSNGAMYPLSTWYPKFQKQFPEAPQYSRLEDLEHFRMDTNGKFRYEP
jgi:hypothetical protein